MMRFALPTTSQTDAAAGEACPHGHVAWSRRSALRLGVSAMAGLALPPARAQAQAVLIRRGIAMHGEAALPDGAPYFAYVRPDAPKGGRLVLGAIGTFDSLNPFIVRGVAVPQMRGHVTESLMTRGQDEPFTLYGHIAESVETDDARSFATFRLDPRAAFSDGRPVTAADILMSWQVLKDRGRPNHRTYYRKVQKAEALDPRTVRFSFPDARDRELVLILGLMPVLASHTLTPESFERTSLTPLTGTGPYLASDIVAGSGLTLRRRADYWAAGAWTQKGLWNFDEIRIDYYRDANIQFEAFRKGLIDVRAETDPGRWQGGYDFPGAADGAVIRDAIPTGLPKGMAGLVFNARRQPFADIRVREALVQLFDFEWINRTLHGGAYTRTGSYFEGSELSARGRPADEAERALLAPFPGAVRADIMAGTWQPPVTDGSGRDRAGLARALDLFAAAGFRLREGRMVEASSGRPLGFELLVIGREQERLALAWQRSLERAGIALAVRLVDAAQYERRRNAYDFDMIQNLWPQSLSPGNEQSFYWGAAAADQPGTRNYMGVKNPAVDAMIAALLKARARQDFISAVRALDRVLLSGFHVVPLFHLPEQWMARWRRIARPDRQPLTGALPESWWFDPSSPPRGSD
jgi:peptide/nickel transport system substrate-binding protein